MRISTILDALFPSACAGCGEGDEVLCAACAPGGTSGQHFWLGTLPVTALGTYDGSLRRSILAFKRGRRDVGFALARALARHLASGPVRGVLIPIPTTPERRAERGFDQGILLAREAARLAGFGVLDVLRQVAGDAQRGRTRTARLKARDRFRAQSGSLLEGTQVILIDDVATTGATLRDCAAVLTAAGARVAGGIVLARAP